MDVIKEQVMVKTGQETMPAHLARPKSGGPYPGFVVVMEAFGLNEHIKSITERFAAEGFVAISPNLYFRQPNNIVQYNDLPGAFRLMGALRDDQVVADMTAAIAHLKTIKEAKPVFGTTGFCMGGRVAFMAACRNGEVAATVPFYGGGMVTSRQPETKAPIEYVGGLKAPVLAFFGGKDAFIPQAEVDKFKAELEKAKKQAEVILYPDADHGFMCDERPSYHPAHAREAFARTIAFFRKHLS